MLRFARRTFRGMGPKAVLVLSGVLALMALVSLGLGGEAEVNAVQVRRLEEEKPTKEGVAMAATLLGSISFIMCLYYFINYDDKDIKQASWETISNTISIFCAVLLWSSFNDLAETYVIEPIFGEGEETAGALFVDMLHMLVWTGLMQLTLGWLSRATGPFQIEKEQMEVLENGGSIDQKETNPEGDNMEDIIEKVEINMACYAVLLAHITGFATINAFGTLQQKFFKASPFMAFLAVPIAFSGQLVIQRITDEIRERISMGDDGKKDEFEKKWDEETEEAENDVMGLTLSFLTINAMRFMLTGCLPNQEGKEEECPKATGWEDGFLYHHTAGQKWSLVAAGLLFTGLLCIVRMYFPEWLEEAEIENKYKEDKAAMVLAKGVTKKEAHAQLHPAKHRLKMVGRLAEGVVVAISMCFSWSVFYGFQMVLAGHPSFEGQPQLLAVVLALVISLPLMFLLFPLDSLADAEWTKEKMDKAIRGTMQAMALTIGFAWEQCFDACVDAIAVTQGEKGIINVHTTKLALTIFCAGLLVPAWKWYILPFMVAKGWSYGYVWGPNTLENIAKKIQDEIEDEKGEGTEEEKKEGQEKQKAKLKKVEEVLQKRLEELRKSSKMAGYDIEEGSGVNTTSYTALAGDDVGALRQKNAQLAQELEKARAAGLKAQQMLDQTMENMFSSLKLMNVTVSKIEESNSK